MSLKQISVFVENHAGQLSEVTAMLAENNIDLRALHISETADYGVLRLIASEWERAEKILREQNVIVSLCDVISVSVPDQPGGLSSLLAVLSKENVDISYMYSVFGKEKAGANMVFKVADVEKVEALLKANGFDIDTVD